MQSTEMGVVASYHGLDVKINHNTIYLASKSVNYYLIGLDLAYLINYLHARET
jgi:hypothetical protein